MPPLDPALRTGDRSSDERAVVGGVAKPPILSRVTLRLLCAGCLVAILYGTLGPLGSSRTPWVVTVAPWRWIPPPQPSDLDDVLTNLAVYFPVGVAFRLLALDYGSNNPGHPSMSVAGIGMDKARHIFFDVLTLYALPSTSWTNLGDLAVDAAFIRYNTCYGQHYGNPVLALQQSAHQAFAAIGYPSNQFWNTCWN